MSSLDVAYFYACAALAAGGAVSVVMAKNPIRSAMGLLLLILSVAGLFLQLHAEFLAAVQLIVYAGAIVVLFLFVIMLLGPSASTPDDRRGIVVRTASGGIFALGGIAVLFVAFRATAMAHHKMPMPKADLGLGGIDAFGGVLFSDAIVPFELSSALLMVAVIGAIAVARGRQGIKSLSPSDEAIARQPPAPPPVPGEHSGVFSHEVEVGHALGGADGAEGHSA
jgi:NADH-quinone oxidoreductase subunit J